MQETVYLSHHGIKGMKWGVWNDETRARRLGRGLLSFAKGVGYAYVDTASMSFRIGKSLCKILLGSAGKALVSSINSTSRKGNDYLFDILSGDIGQMRVSEIQTSFR